MAENGDQIFPAMLNGIRSAKRSITFENFLFREGEVSDAFAEALADRARHGVKVHFLQDALGCDATPNRRFRLQKRGQLFIGAHNEPLSVVAMWSAIQIVRPLESIAETQPQLQPPLLGCQR